MRIVCNERLVGDPQPSGHAEVDHQLAAVLQTGQQVLPAPIERGDRSTASGDSGRELGRAKRPRIDDVAIDEHRSELATDRLHLRQFRHAAEGNAAPRTIDCCMEADIKPVVLAVRAAAGDHDVDPSLLARFAKLLLDRLGGADLHVGDAERGALVETLVDLYRRMDARRSSDVAVALQPPGSTLLDGTSSDGSVVELLCEDRQFIVTSVSEELYRLGYRVVRMFHPVIGSARGPSGAIANLIPARGADQRESIAQLELDSVVETARHDLVVDSVARVLDDVFQATGDNEAIRAAIDAASDALRDAREFEAASLLDWLEADHFVPLGCCRFVPEASGSTTDDVIVRLDAGLGLLAEPGGPLRQPVPDLNNAPVVCIARTTEISRVHRRVPVHRIDMAIPQNGLSHVVRIVGVFTRAADSEPSVAIPVLRTKLEAVLERHDAVPGSYDEQTLTSVFDVLPRD